MVENKIMPQAIDLEQLVLGQLMYNREAADLILPILNEKVFYLLKNQKVFKAINELWTKNNAVDIITVTKQLQFNGDLEFIGGVYFLSGLGDRIGTTQNIEFHIAILQQKYFAREIIEASQLSIRDAFDETIDIFDVLNTHNNRVDKIHDHIDGNKKPDTISTLAEKSFQDYFARKIATRENKITGVPTGLTELNQATGGWQKGELIIIAGRPAMGKSAIACNLAINAEKIGTVAFFTLEMTAQQITDRFLLFISALDASKFKDGYLTYYEEEQLEVTKNKLATLKIHIDAKPSISINYLRSACRRIKKNNGLEMIVVDYLQLMSGVGQNKNFNREQEMSSISRGLKEIAKEFDVPVIALAQLSREVEKRGGNKIPQLSDLRESGSIEQDADIVIFAYRPAYYEITEDPDGQSTEGVGCLIISKNRNGKTKTIKFKHNESLTQIFDAIDYSQSQSQALKPNTTFYDTQSGKQEHQQDQTKYEKDPF